MLEYGIKSITTNPTLITKTDEIIRLIDTRNNETRAFVLPATFEPIVKKLAKELEFRRWVEEKKSKVGANDENFDDLMEAGWENIVKYLDEK